VASVYVER
jgi:hypothetical protein